MKSILVAVEESEVLSSVLEATLLVARHFGSYVEGLYVSASLIAVGAPDGLASAALIESFEQQDRERAQRARQIFETFMREKGVAQSDPANTNGQPWARWLEMPYPSDAILGNRGRVFDLIVVGRPVRQSVAPRMTTLEAALFESGRPILIAPPRPPKELGKAVMIAWNGSTETARTIAFAMPFLTRAERVSVLSVEDGVVSGPTGAEVAKHLRLHGVSATAIEMAAGSKSVGEVILREAAAQKTDLLVKGAYTHSRLRQMIFGGTTSHILDAAELPVFMAH